MNSLPAVTGAWLACLACGVAPEPPAPRPAASVVTQPLLGGCDVAPGACLAAIQASGGVVNDIFRDANGRTARQLPVFGKLFNNHPGCGRTNFVECSGRDTHVTAADSCPGFVCEGAANTFANAESYLNTLDHRWWQPCRLQDRLRDASGCPSFGRCVADGAGGNHEPSEGLVFDLGGPTNQVVIFASNDHGPQPCESLEYTVYLSDNPMAVAKVDHPGATGVDPAAWNRAVLTRVYTLGWEDLRPPSPGNACGDTDTFAVESDAFVQTYALPCGLTFRFASVVAGNDGLDFPACAYNSQEAEVDAVAGLTAQGAGVCPDADRDGFLACNCDGTPQPCDCDDGDPATFPGAPTTCAGHACEGQRLECAPAQRCVRDACRSPCAGGTCDAGLECRLLDGVQLCLPPDCALTGCAAAQVCNAAGNCEATCVGVPCPAGQACRAGACVDACAGVTCAAGRVCVDGACTAPCSCLATNLVCGPARACNAVTGTCGAASCTPMTCPAPYLCSNGACVPNCPSGVCGATSWGMGGGSRPVSPCACNQVREGGVEAALGLWALVALRLWKRRRQPRQ